MTYTMETIPPPPNTDDYTTGTIFFYPNTDEREIMEGIYQWNNTAHNETMSHSFTHNGVLSPASLSWRQKVPHSHDNPVLN